MIRAGAASHDVSERVGAEEGIDQRVQKRQRGLAVLVPGLVDQRAERRPDRRTPAGTANLHASSLKNQHRALVGVGGSADIRHQALSSCRYTVTPLPAR